MGYNMFKKLLLFFSVIILLCILINKLNAQETKVDDIFEGYSSEYVGGYLKPVFTSIHQGLNSNFFSNNNYKKGEWRFGLDISGNAMMVPESQKSFTTAIPGEWKDSKIYYLDGSGNTVYTGEKSITQPTVYGSRSTPLFSTDTLNNSSLVKTYLEGINLSNVSTLPNLQFVIGLPTQTEVRLRGFGGEGAMYYGIIINQRVDELLNLFGTDSKHSLGVNFAYQGASFEHKDTNSTRNLEIALDMNTIAFGLNYGYNIAKNFNLYSGAQFETLSGNLDAIYLDKSDISNNTLPNVINADVTSYTNFRALVGLSYKLAFAEFHVDGIYASQPMLTAGITFHFGSWGIEEETITKEPKLEETKTEEVKQ